MELTFAQQSQAFFYSLLLGAALACFYGVIKLLRFIFSPGKAATAMLDILFMLLWALALFYFCLGFLWGNVRVHVVLGSLLGFLTYRLTIGRLLFRLYSPVVRFLKTRFQKICRKLKIFANYLLKIACKILYNIRNKRENFRKKHKQASTKQRKSYEFKTTKHQTDGG